MSTQNKINTGGLKASGENKKNKKSSSSGSPITNKGLNHYGIFLDKTESESVLALQIMKAVAKANGEKTSIKGKNATMTLAKYRAESVVGVLRNKPWREFFDANKIENFDDRNTPGRHPVPGEQVLLSNKNNSFNPSRSRNENLLSTDSILTSFSTSSVEYGGNNVHNPNGIDRESKAIRMIRRIQVLWDELKIPSDDRSFYLSTLCQLAYPCPSLEQMAELTKHIVMLLNHRKATIDVLKKIENREILLKKTLKDLVSIQKKSFVALTNASSFIWKKELLQLFVDLQIATLVVIHSIQIWRRNLWRPYPFMWKKVNYINKIKSDLDLLETDFFRNLIDSFPLYKKDLLCLVFPSQEDNDNKNKEKNAKLDNTSSTINNDNFNSKSDEVEESNDLRSFFISSGVTLYKKELQAASRVVQEESLLQCALRVEHEALRTRGVFIPTLRVDATLKMEESQEDGLDVLFNTTTAASLRDNKNLFKSQNEEQQEEEEGVVEEDIYNMQQEEIDNEYMMSTLDTIQPETEFREALLVNAPSPSSYNLSSPKGSKSPTNVNDYKMLAFQSDKLSTEEDEDVAENNSDQDEIKEEPVSGKDKNSIRERLNELSTHSNSASMTGVANFLPFDPVDPLEVSEAGDADIDLDELFDLNDTKENSDDDM